MTTKTLTQKDLSLPVAKFIKDRSNGHYKVTIADNGNVNLRLIHHNWDFEAQRVFREAEERFDQVERQANYGSSMTFFIMTPSEYEMNNEF